MAPEAEELGHENGMDDKTPPSGSNGRLQPEKDEEDEEEEDEDDEEPRLKYAILTQNLKPVYRNGDATSAFLTAGDKMVSFVGLSERFGMEVAKVHRLLEPTMEIL